MKTGIEELNAETKRRCREKQSFENAGEGYVFVKSGKERQVVDPGTIVVGGVKLADILQRLIEVESQVKGLEHLVDSLSKASEAQSKLLHAIIETLKGVKL